MTIIRSPAPVPAPPPPPPPVPVAGAYKFVFVAGSWDSTYGTIIGGQMLIDNIRKN